MAENVLGASDEVDLSRRKFLTAATSATGAVGVVFAAIPFVASWKPSERAMALGADWCNAARGFMFALGCIQAQTCHTGACPTGVTTQDPQRQKALDVMNKADRVYHFHQNTLLALKELVQAPGIAAIER